MSGQSAEGGTGPRVERRLRADRRRRRRQAHVVRRGAGRAPDRPSVRPLVSVFMPERLELLKGAPALRRAHLDQLDRRVLAARSATAASMHGCSRSATPAQRASAPGGLEARARRATWDRELAVTGLALMAPPRSRRAARAALRRAVPSELGLDWRTAALEYRPAPRPPTTPSSSPSSRPVFRRDLHAGSPATAHTATSWRSCVTAASCASTARRGSSDWPCWPCCWPSAAAGAPSATARR